MKNSKNIGHTVMLNSFHWKCWSYYFADSTLSAWSRTSPTTIRLLEEFLSAWSRTNNKMMVSLRKFKAIILDFKKSDLTNKGMVMTTGKIKLFHRLNISWKLSFKARRVLINNHVVSNLNYCPCHGSFPM